MGFVWLNILFFVLWQVDFQWASCVSIFSFLCYGWQTFSGVPVAQSFVFCVMVGRPLVGFVWLNLQFSVSWLVDFQWSSCGSIFSFLCLGWQTFSGFVWLNLQFSVSWQVDFQWVRVAQFLVFCVMVGRLLGGSCGSIFSFLCPGWQTFSGLRVAQSLDFCVMVGRLLVGFVCLNLQFSVSWLVDFQWVRVAQTLVFCVMVGKLLVGSCGSIFSFLCHGWQTFSGVRVAQSLVFCVMVGILFVGFVWLNLQFSVSWQVDFQWGSCGSIFSFLCHSWQTFSGVRVAQSLVFCVMVGRLLVGFVWLNLQFSVSLLVDFYWVRVAQSLCFLCHGWQTFGGVRVAQSLVFCVMVGRPLVGFVWLNLQFSVSWLVDFQWGSCGSIFSFLCHGWQTFSGLRVAQSLDFCVMVGRLLVGFVWLNLLFFVSWLVDFQWGSCGSIFSFLCHGRQIFRGVRVAQFLVFCVMVGRLLVGFLWPNLFFYVSWLVDFQWASCVSIFSFLCHGWQTFSGFVWHNLQFSVSWLVDFQWVRVAQSLVFCVLVGRLSVGFVWLNLQISVSWQVDFQWGSCGSIFVFCVMVGRLLEGFVWLNLQFFVSWQVDFQWAPCVSIFSFLCYGWQTFSGVRVDQSFVFCVMVSRLLVGFVWLNLQFSVLWLVDFQWGSCGPIFSFLCHGRQTFSGVRVSQSLVFCVMVGRLLMGSCGSNFSFLCHGWQTFSGFVWLNLQFSVSWLVDFQWGSCDSVFSFLCHGWQTFCGVRVAQSLVFCVMVGRLLVGFVWLNLQFFVSWLVDFQWGSCGSIFSFLCHGWQTFRGVRVAQSLVFCVIVGRLLLGSCGSIFMFSVSWLVDFWWGP